MTNAMGPVVAIMQPTFLPWLGYLDLMDRVDVFVYLDDAELSRQSFQTRNRIRGVLPEPRWLSLRHARKRQGAARIIDVSLVEPEATVDSFEGVLGAAYERGPGTLALVSALRHSLVDPVTVGAANMALLEWLRSRFRVTTPTVRASDFPTEGTRSQRLAELLTAMDASAYVAVPGAIAYMNEDGFSSIAPCPVAIHRHDPARYPQSCTPFTPYLSSVDALLELDDERARDVMLAGRRPLEDWSG